MIEQSSEKLKECAVKTRDCYNKAGINIPDVPDIFRLFALVGLTVHKNCDWQKNSNYRGFELSKFELMRFDFISSFYHVLVFMLSLFYSLHLIHNPTQLKKYTFYWNFNILQNIYNGKEK